MLLNKELPSFFPLLSSRFLLCLPFARRFPPWGPACSLLFMAAPAVVTPPSLPPSFLPPLPRAHQCPACTTVPRSCSTTWYTLAYIESCGPGVATGERVLQLGVGGGMKVGGGGATSA
jgi:hypothetical protein